MNCPRCHTVLDQQRLQYLKEGRARYYICPSCKRRIRVIDAPVHLGGEDDLSESQPRKHSYLPGRR